MNTSGKFLNIFFTAQIKDIAVAIFCIIAFLATAQRPTFYLLTDPTKNTGNSYSFSAQIQAPQCEAVALTGGLMYQMNQSVAVDDYSVASESTTQNVAVNYYPFGKSIWNKNRSLNDKPTVGCYSFEKQRAANDLLGGLYFKAGYEQRHSVLTLTPRKELNDPKVYEVNIYNRAALVGVGYQVQIYSIVLGVGYNATIGKPSIEGDFKNIEKTLLTNSFPFAFRLEHCLTLEVGLAF